MYVCMYNERINFARNAAGMAQFRPYVIQIQYNKIINAHFIHGHFNQDTSFGHNEQICIYFSPSSGSDIFTHFE